MLNSQSLDKLSEYRFIVTPDTQQRMCWLLTEDSLKQDTAV